MIFVVMSFRPSFGGRFHRRTKNFNASGGSIFEAKIGAKKKAARFGAAIGVFSYSDQRFSIST
jgi:hypothetical protein